MAQLAAEHPELATLRELGRSWQGRPLKALEITAGNHTKPTIFLEGGIHAREWIATSTVLYIAGPSMAGLSEAAGQARCSARASCLR